jgi:hypothetical protein
MNSELSKAYSTNTLEYKEIPEIVKYWNGGLGGYRQETKKPARLVSLAGFSRISIPSGPDRFSARLL